jgi:hypothetical protein
MSAFQLNSNVRLKERNIAVTDIIKIQEVAESCRRGLESLTNRSGSVFFKFPVASCGPAAEIVGRILKEKLGCNGVYVCGVGHPDLRSNQSHAWFEIGNYIIDITYDQFPSTGLSGWVFERGVGWHAEFTTLDVREGFCTQNGWPDYPFDGYGAALNEFSKHNC